ncbi:MAG: 2-hydroxychromene-2-carboxylate isomerase [Alphaproteobacteria bacterium]|nr:2-hydroxychromene-2-carboxylate isomerase [Alphaproteobacteria bacterium]
MGKQIDYYYALVSPWSFIGHARLIDIAKRNGATIAYKPMNLGKLFPSTGGTVFKDRHPSRLAYRLIELERWNKHLNFGLNVQPKFFPVPESLAAPLVIAAGLAGHDMGSLSLAYMRAVWQEERNIADAQTVIDIAQEQGFDGQALLDSALEGSPAWKTWEANTQEAVEKGVFGAPWYQLEGVPFWGQDRLDFLEESLKTKA